MWPYLLTFGAFVAGVAFERNKGKTKGESAAAVAESRHPRIVVVSAGSNTTVPVGSIVTYGYAALGHSSDTTVLETTAAPNVFKAIATGTTILSAGGPPEYAATIKVV